VDVRELLAARALPVALSPQSTGYFSAPHEMFDPVIFDGTSMRPTFSCEQLTDVMSFLSTRCR
jgi:hypothetical protein